MDKFNFVEKYEEIVLPGIDRIQKDFLLTWQWSEDEIKKLLNTAEFLKALHQNGISSKVFNSGIAISIFRDQSTRTRFSFASAVNQLGLALSELDEVKSQVAHGETVFETANMISFLTEVIGIRDDMYLGEGNKYMEEVGRAVQYGFDNKILHQRPVVINLQSDIDHPTQTMSDLLKLKNYFGSIENLKGKKIAMSWAYSPSYGKPLSVPQGIIGLMTRFGMNVSLAYPEGYDLLPEITKLAKENSNQSGGSFEIVNSMDESFKDADIVYPKSWAPFHIMERRTELLKTQDINGLKDLENECLENNNKFVEWECTQEKINLTKNKNALYQHCLPADITGISCEKGEVSSEVFEKYKLHTYDQASNKPFIIAAMIFLNRISNPGKKLLNLFEDQKRIQL